MFDGLAIKAGETANLEGENGEVFHLSQACLSDPKDAGKSYLKIKEGDRSLVVCCLQKDKNEHAALDIFVHPATNSFSVEGKNDIHLVGYWEPHGESDDDEDELDFMADEAEESDEAGESDLDDEIPSLLNGDRAKKPQGMPSAAKAGESDEEDDEELGESDDESEMPVAVPQTKAGKGLPAGVSANKQKPSQQPKQAPKSSPALKSEAQPAKAAAGKAKATPKAAPKVAAANESQASQKRKQAPAEKTSTQPPAKQAKTAATPAAAGKGTTDAAGDDKFQSDLTEYLTKHGRTTMSELGSKVKKPAGVAKKLAAFLKDRTNLFKVDGTHVEMAK